MQMNACSFRLLGLLCVFVLRASAHMIDRATVVQRHRVNLHGIGLALNQKPGSHPVGSPLTLSVGNGLLASNVDVTGFHSLNTTYDVFPLTTLSDWGWHSQPWPKDIPSPFEAYNYTYYNISTGRDVPYPLESGDKAGSWLRANPHRLQLVQVSLRKDTAPDTPLVASDLRRNGDDATQSLDPWTGVVTSSFDVGERGAHMTSEHACHMDLDILSWRLNGTTDEGLVLRLAFPYGNEAEVGSGGSWENDAAHTTTIIHQGNDFISLQRTLDYDSYVVACRYFGTGWALERSGPHSFVIQPHDRHSASRSVELSCLFAPTDVIYPIGRDQDWLQLKAETTRALLKANGATLPDFGKVSSASLQGWQKFWSSRAFVDIASHAADERAHELERRVVLSQYLTRSQSAGTLPTAETGLTMNSWYGKFHHEMRWFHQVHFGLWGSPELLRRSDEWYLMMLQNATSYATFQGYDGARWPKMAAPVVAPLERPGKPAMDAPSVGRTTYSNSTFPLLYWTGPSAIGPLLIWEQPHPIWISEMERQMASTPEEAKAVVERLFAIVNATAEFMASYPVHPPAGAPGVKKPGELWLGPPLMPAEEGSPPLETWNPTFELTYWRLGLRLANQWLEHMGLPANPRWQLVIDNLALPPTVQTNVTNERVYVPNANCDGFPHISKYHCFGAYQSHPMFLASLGMINGLNVDPPIDIEIMNATVRYALAGWDWLSTWGWDYGLLAFTMTRLNYDPSSIVDILLLDTQKNIYFANGQDYEDNGLPCYLPGNGALLSATAMMCGGFAGADGHAVNANWFPATWQVKCEGFKPYP